MKPYYPSPGEDILTACKTLCFMAVNFREPASMVFNQITVTAQPGDDPEAVSRSYGAELQRRRDEYEASPEYAKAQRESKERQEKKARDLAEALAGAPATLTLADPDGWGKGIAANTDPYGACIYRYADKWARVMEARIAGGATLEACADEASRLADDEGITGFMYGAAVSVLSKAWIHGEALRKWHNLNSQIGDEGERANASGGVLNPALLTIGG